MSIQIYRGRWERFVCLFVYLLTYGWGLMYIDLKLKDFESDSHQWNSPRPFSLSSFYHLVRLCASLKNTWEVRKDKSDIFCQGHLIWLKLIRRKKEIRDIMSLTGRSNFVILILKWQKDHVTALSDICSDFMRSYLPATWEICGSWVVGTRNFFMWRVYYVTIKFSYF